MKSVSVVAKEILEEVRGLLAELPAELPVHRVDVTEGNLQIRLLDLKLSTHSSLTLTLYKRNPVGDGK